MTEIPGVVKLIGGLIGYFSVVILIIVFTRDIEHAEKDPEE